MLRNHTTLAASFLLAALSCGSAAAEVVATVNGQEINEQDVNNYIREQNLNAEQAMQRDKVLNDLIARELVHQDALKRGIDKRQDVLDEVEKMRKRIILNTTVREALQANPVTEAEIKAEYEKQLPRLTQDEYKARHILLETEDAAKDVIAQLDKGADFAALAKEKSTGPSGPNGGDLGWFAAGQMVPEFSRAVAAMKKGEHSKAPVQTQFGWHVIKLEDSRTSEPPSYEQLKPRIQSFVQQRHIAQYIEGLREKAKVEIK